MKEVVIFGKTLTAPVTANRPVDDRGALFAFF
jgi:hypothetical protein